jgi:hemerythrin-like domain-containing protein
LIFVKADGGVSGILGGVPHPPEAAIHKHASVQIILDEHASLSAMLRSMLMMVARGPGDHAQRFFDVLRAMLFYIDEFPERLHHPKESNLLFPRVVRLAPAVMPIVERLERDHMNGEKAVRELQHLLLAWELLGEPRKPAFELHCKRYVEFYLEHMRLEESVILPEAEKVLGEADWKELDADFLQNRDPLASRQAADPVYDRLFSRIVREAPAPIGLGDA